MTNRIGVCNIRNSRWFSLAMLASVVCVVDARGKDVRGADSANEVIQTESRAEEVSYHRSVLPLLRSRCFTCHGPDEGTREADLRLDIRDDAVRDRDGTYIVKPGHPEASSIIERLSTSDTDIQMPPPDSGHERLTPKQIDVIRTWISQGAAWSTHWAYARPKRPAIPEVKRSEWIRNPIDAFILKRLEQEQIQPSEPANRTTLLRRLSLDLIGLPPTIEEVDSFLADDQPGAYQRQVERLLKSPHYGEKWGRFWLDAARYADSDGFEKDKPREVWFYRDWVINSLNNDLPYNQFIIEQVAGDLLPNATQDQVVATGFLRNSMLNEEGGIDPEEFRMQAMFDRMDTIGKSILGITVQCAQCHSHKYDPFSQVEYYRMFAFLNNCHEAQPTVYTERQQREITKIKSQVSAIENRLREDKPDWQQLMSDWEWQAKSAQADWTVLPIENAGNNSQRYYQQDDKSLLAQGYAPTRVEAPFSVTTDMPEIRSFRLEALNHPNLPAGGPGRASNGLFALSEFRVTAVSVKDPSKTVQVKFTRATADYSNTRVQLQRPYTDKNGKNAGFTGPVSYAIDGDNKTAWGIDAGPGRRNQPRQAVFVADRNVAFPGGTQLTFTLVQRHGGWNSDDNQTMNLGRFRISATSGEAIADPCPANVRRIMDIPVAERTAEQTEALFSFWRTTVADWKKENQQIKKLWQQHPEGTTQYVLQEQALPRQTHLLERGDFLKKGDIVDANTPRFLNPLDESNVPSRLRFAQWLVDKQSPTTARSIVNRIWQAYFGTGIVDTPEDLGTTGSTPSHPKLLDWLATELVNNNWSLKHIHTLIVHSSTYQQTSKVKSELLTRDPQNRLLARGARFRVDAEVVRDIMLTASGLLNANVGGPSVFPPAPAFLFQRPASYGPKTWKVETGPNRYRRAIYTFRFRSIPHPALQAFDAPSGEIATVKRTRSNTPLQALVSLNEPVANECARALAHTTITSSGPSDNERMTYAFRRCVSRHPTDDERKLLVGLFNKQSSRFESNTLDAKLILSDNKNYEPPEDIDIKQLAAWTVLSRVLLSLDETITKE